MKRHVAVLSFLLTQFVLAGQTANPVQDYATFHGLTGSVIYRWTVDLNNDGKLDVLLDTKLTGGEIAQENRDTKNRYNPNLHGFALYIAQINGSGYVESTGINDGTEFGLAACPEIDITQCFVGQITELNAYGVVTIRVDAPRTGPAIARIVGYTVEGDHVKETKLAEYNPEQPNALYEKYLVPSKRTQVQLELLAP